MKYPTTTAKYIQLCFLPNSRKLYDLDLGLTPGDGICLYTVREIREQVIEYHDENADADSGKYNFTRLLTVLAEIASEDPSVMIQY